MRWRPGNVTWASQSYKLGVELLRHIEMRWDKGQFGQEWEECDSMAVKASWDRRLGLGRDKIFEVRKLYNDITFHR